MNVKLMWVDFHVVHYSTSQFCSAWLESLTISGSHGSGTATACSSSAAAPASPPALPLQQALERTEAPSPLDLPSEHSNSPRPHPGSRRAALVRGAIQLGTSGPGLVCVGLGGSWTRTGTTGRGDGEEELGGQLSARSCGANEAKVDRANMVWQVRSSNANSRASIQAGIDWQRGRGQDCRPRVLLG